MIFLLNYPFSAPGNQEKPSAENPHTTATLQFEPTQDSDKILDQSIQSTGCNAVLSLKPGTTSTIQMKSDNKQRSYLLYIPSSFSNTEPHALIMSFHGYASNDLTQEKISQFNSIANSNNIIIVYPQGTTGLLAARGWNTGHHPTITAKDVLFVSNLLNTLQANLCIDPKQIYATGFSNGGGFSGELACKLSNRIAAYAPISGSYMTAFSSCPTTRAVSILEFHGTADKINPYTGISDINELSTQIWLTRWAKKDDCSSKPEVTQETKNIIKYVWKKCRDGAAIIHYKIVGEGHFIPKVKFPLTINGKVQKVNSSGVIWNFFQQHPLK